MLRKFWNLHIKISKENWLFIYFLSHLLGPLSFYTALENNTIFLQQFFRFRGGGEASPLPPPCGRPCPSISNGKIVIEKWYYTDFCINFYCFIKIRLEPPYYKELQTHVQVVKFVPVLTMKFSKIFTAKMKVRIIRPLLSKIA